MPGIPERDIHGGIGFISLSLISEGIDVLVVGGGRAGYIKASSFIDRGAAVTLISEKLDGDFDRFTGNNLFLHEKKRYAGGEMDSYHLVVIAVDDQEAAEEIRRECRDKHKVFIDCTDFKKGNASMPSARTTSSMHLSIQTRGGNPATSRFMADLMKDKLEGYDQYVEFSTAVRYRLKKNPLKKEIMDFISTEDFIYMFQKELSQKTDLQQV